LNLFLAALRVKQPLPQHPRDNVACKDCCANTNLLTYLLTSIDLRRFYSHSDFSSSAEVRQPFSQHETQ